MPLGDRDVLDGPVLERARVRALRPWRVVAVFMGCSWW